MRCFLLWLLPACLVAGTPSQKAMKAITPEEAKSLVDFLAADSMKGRYTPSPELDRCADWLAAKFHAYGCEPVNGSYFQQIHLNRIYLGDSNFVILKTRLGGEKMLEIKKDYMPFETTANQQVEGEVVFVGYGISDSANHYDDYAGVDVSGKVVLALKGGPNEKKPSSPFALEKRAEATRLQDKVQAAIDHRAIGFMLVTNPLHSSLLKPAGFPWPHLFKGFPPDAVPISLAKEEKRKIPCVQVGEEALRTLFGSVDSCRAIAQKIDSLFQPHSMVLTGKQVAIKTTTRIRTQFSRNVVAMIPGADAKLKQEWLIIGGHYDHVGVRSKTEAGQDSIFNGADDNASGTAGVMLIAAAFAAEKERPKRSLLFIAFAGEERGFYGSSTYVDDPLFPLQQTVAMINLDMIGRNRVDSLTIYGKFNAPDLWAIAEKENKQIGFKLSTGLRREAGGSDHVSFNKKNIPTLFFHSGLHQDYHQVGDQAEKINYGKMVYVSKLAFRTAWQLANSSSHPALLTEAR